MTGAPLLPAPGAPLNATDPEGEVAWLRAELERRKWPGLWPALQRFWRGGE